MVIIIVLELDYFDVTLVLWNRRDSYSFYMPIFDRVPVLVYEVPCSRQSSLSTSGWSNTFPAVSNVLRSILPSLMWLILTYPMQVRMVVLSMRASQACSKYESLNGDKWLDEIAGKRETWADKAPFLVTY